MSFLNPFTVGYCRTPLIVVLMPRNIMFLRSTARAGAYMITEQHILNIYSQVMRKYNQNKFHNKLVTFKPVMVKKHSTFDSVREPA